MNQESENPEEFQPEGDSRPVIPQPNLNPLPPPPQSPLNSGPRFTAPPSFMPSNDAVKVKLRSGAEDEDSPMHGLVPFNTRITAAVIDLVVSVGLSIGLTLLLPGFAHKIAYIASLGYLITRDSLPFLGGQSIGKKAMKIKVVSLEGKSLVGNWETAIIRNGVLLIPLFAFVELFILLTREDKRERGRRLGDEWAKTQVIFDEKPLVPEGDVRDSKAPTDAISR
jgi:uncharacterized RDD family membrane protein YckC